MQQQELQPIKTKRTTMNYAIRMHATTRITTNHEGQRKHLTARFTVSQK